MLELLQKAYPEINFRYIGKDTIMGGKIESDFILVNTKYLLIITSYVCQQYDTEYMLISHIKAFRDIDICCGTLKPGENI